MGVTLPKGTRFAGFGVSAIKCGLHSIQKTGSAFAFSELKGVGADLRERAILFEELMDRRLIEEHRGSYSITDRGIAVANSSGTARVPIEKAKAHLDELKERIVEFNNDPDGIFSIDRLWLFGSAMRGEATVGDIDITLETSRRPPYDTDYELFRQRMNHDLKLAGVPAGKRHSLSFCGESWLIRRGIFGMRRHPIFSEVPFFNLVSLGAPCQLIFDRLRGGVVEDAILERHPKSPGRSKDAPKPLELPDLSAPSVRPMHASWLGGWVGERLSPPGYFFKANRRAAFLLRDYAQGLAVTTTGADGGRGRRRGLREAQIDGRERVLLELSHADQAGSVVLHRTIEEGDRGPEIIVRLENGAVEGNPSVSVPLSCGLACAVALLATTDAHRVMRRKMDCGEDNEVSIIVEVGSPGEALTESVAHATNVMLHKGVINIEPDGWIGDPAVVGRSPIRFSI